jgi:hypothetical protein
MKAKLCKKESCGLKTDHKSGLCFSHRMPPIQIRVDLCMHDLSHLSDVDDMVFNLAGDANVIRLYFDPANLELVRKTISPASNGWSEDYVKVTEGRNASGETFVLTLDRVRGKK